MELLHARCAGLDVHKASVMACARVVERKRVKREVRSFETTTKGLLSLLDWLSEHGCTHVGMEATGVYWKPVWHVLEGVFELVLANAQHVRNVPGRKTDVKDAEWIAELLAHGLIRPSFVPPTEIQEMRDLTRTRKQLVREVSQHTLRIQKTLEDANLKVASAISDILGQSGRAILEALIQGQDDPEQLVQLCSPRLKASREVLVESLRGRVRDHHRFLLKLHLEQVDALRNSVEQLEQRLARILRPFRERAALLLTIPGVSNTVAQVLLAEIGYDMSRFPTAAHLVSWAGLCPRNDQSAGKRRSTRVRKGAPWLKTTLVQAAWAAVRKKDCYFRAQFARIKARRGPKKAVLAVAASMLTAAYHMLQRHLPYQDLGPDHFLRTDRPRIARALVRRLNHLGYTVQIDQAPS